MQEPLKIEKIPEAVSKVDIPTPGMLQVMQLREERERQKNLNKLIKKPKKLGSGKSNSPSTEATPSPGHRTRRLRQNVHSKSNSLSASTENNYSFSPELF